MIEDEKIIPVDIEAEMRTSYIDYSMSVIVARALPDVRDGMKPVHRRVLFGMNELGNNSDKPYKKSARVVGDVLGKFHPHGDSSVYYALVRLAQDWNMRYPLVDGQGNFGSVDGDSPAAMRYTECRLRRMAEDMMLDIDKDTVDLQNNFDDTLKEPVVLPTRIPNLLVNGASGIAVGMATNMPPHNLSEVVDGIVAYINNNDITVAELMQYIKAPDFPTGGYIYGYAGVKEAFETGKGRIVLRSKATIESTATHDQIIVTEIPYAINKAELIKGIADLVSDKKIEGISNINDESDRSGMRIVIDVKRDANASVVLNKLFKMTALQSSFSVNNIALVNGRPMSLNLKDLIHYFVEHRHEVVTRRTKFELAEAEKRDHILQGLIIAADNIDRVIAIIKASSNAEDARTNLMAEFNLSDIQARAIVEMRLRQLSILEIDKLHKEHDELMAKIEWCHQVLANYDMRMDIIKDEMEEIKAKYGDERRTEILYASEEFNPEDFYADDDVVITISHLGYIKRTPLAEFRTQNRGGVGSKGGNTRDEDFIEFIYQASMHNTMLFFTQKGKYHKLKVYDIPEGTKTAKGRAIQNVLNIEGDDKVTAYISVKDTSDEYLNSHYLVFATQQAVIKKTALSEYFKSKINGVKAIIIRDDDRVIQVSMTDGNSELVLANRNGRAIRFSEDKVRVMGRVSTGVRAMTLDEDGQDEVVGMIVLEHKDNESIMVVSEKGYGKRSDVEDYRVTNRGGKGVRTMNITDKTGSLIAIKNVSDDNDLMIINKSGITIRLSMADIRVMGRNTQGVRLLNLEKRNDEIASVCEVMSDVSDAEVAEEISEGGSEGGSEEPQA